MSSKRQTQPAGTGRIWIAAGAVLGVILPLLLWGVFQRFYWVLALAGGLLALIGIALEVRGRGQGRLTAAERELKSRIPFDPQKQEAVIRASICTGEKVAGFKDRENGRFKEVMLIRSPEEEERFCRMYGIDSIKTEY